MTTPGESNYTNESADQLDVDQLTEEERRNITKETEPVLELSEEYIFRLGLRTLNLTGITYAVGAAFARYAYTGIWKSTKDLDLFLKPADLKTAMLALEEASFETCVVSPHWLAKAKKGDHVIDLIFGTGHGLLPVDDSSFEGSQWAEILGVTTRLFPVEEMIAAAAYINLRNRFDAAEVLHLIQRSQGQIDWDRIVSRLGDNRQLLLWHLVLFDFVYPGHSDYLPQDLIQGLYDEMISRWKQPAHGSQSFRGMVIDPFSFRVDIDDWGYEDQRDLSPLVNEHGEVL